MRNRVENFFLTYQKHRAALREAWAAYNKGLAELEQYRGSDGYSDSVNQLATKRDKAIKAAREAAAKDFDLTLEGMKFSINHLPLHETTDAEMDALLKPEN